MDDYLAYDTNKLDVVLNKLKDDYYDYTDSLDQLSKEIEKLDNIGSQSLFNDFKEKYEEKRPTLEKVQELTKELIDELSLKNIKLIEATKKTKKSFE